MSSSFRPVGRSPAERLMPFFLVVSMTQFAFALEGDSGTTQTSLATLADEPFSIRRQTTHQLWQDRDRFREMVHEAARGADAELAERARWVLHRWQRGILANTPQELSRQLGLLPPEKAIELLLENGQFDAAIIAMEESAGKIDQDAIVTKLTAALDNKFPNYVRIGQRLGNLDRFLYFLDLCCETKVVALSRFDLMRQLGIPINEANLLPSRSSSWPEIQRSETLCLLHCLRGDIDAAIATAQNHVDAPERSRLLREVFIASSRWQDWASQTVDELEQLTERPLLARETEATRTLKRVRLISDALIASERIGDVELLEQLVAELKQLPMTEIENSDQPASADAVSAHTLRWRCLMRVGEVDTALEILRKLDVNDASMVALEVGKVQQALNWLGYPMERIDAELEQWIDEAVQEQLDFQPDNDSRSGMVKSLENLLTLMEVLAKIGRNDSSFTIAKRLCQPRLMAGQVYLRDYVVSRFMRTKDDWAFELALMPEQTEPDEFTLRIVADGLPIEDPRLIPALSRLILLEEPTSEVRDRFVRACRLVRSQVTDLDDNSPWFSALSRRLADGSLERSLSDRSKGEVWSMPPMESWIALFELNGRSDLMKTWLPSSAPNVGWEKETDFQDPEESLREIQVTIDELLAAIRDGDEGQSMELRERLMLMACSPSLSLRRSIAEKLSEAGQIDNADALYRDLVQITMMTPNDSISFSTVVGEYYSFVLQYLAPPETDLQVWDVAPSSEVVDHKALDHREEILGWRELSFNLGKEWTQSDATTYVMLPSYVAHQRLEIATQRLLDPAMRTAEAGKPLQRLLDLMLGWDPIDITLAESLLPRLRSRGQASIADPVFEKVFAAGRRYLSVCWQDSMMANNVAWSAAMNNRYPDQAIEMARLAVRVEPDSAIYRDTLAELLFRSGEVKQALQIEQACLLDDPGQWHLHQQINRFQSHLSQLNIVQP